jgi:hypothetical protein
MRSIAIPFTLVLSNLLAACGDNGTSGPDAPVAPPTITIMSDPAPALVAFRDGLDAPWQPATMKTPTSFTAEVHGPYVVTVVCEDPATGRSRTLQVARTPDDANNLALPCDLPAMTPSGYAVTGHMVQAGFVQLGSSSDTSEDADWDFQLSAANGSYDLIATTTERIVVRRAIEVNADLVVTPPVDVAAEGTALVNVALTAPDATPDEALAASVDLATPTNSLPARVYLGPAATAKVARNSALLPTDTQSVAVRATNGTALRELQRPFRVGDDTEYALPQPLGGVQWAIEHGQLSTSWITLPQLDHLDMSASSSAADGTELARHSLDMTPLFLAETGITHIAIDTEIPGYKHEWRIDFAGRYTRDLTGKHAVNDDLVTSSVTEAVNAPQPDSGSAPGLARAYDLR